MDIQIGKPLVMLPPAPHLCQICAVKHDEDQPHNAQSFYYQYWFASQNKRLPTWSDAMAHCSDEVKAPWLAQFRACGINISSPNLTGNVQSQSDLDKRLKDLNDLQSGGSNDN